MDRTRWVVHNVIPYDGRYIIPSGQSKRKGHVLMHKFEATVRQRLSRARLRCRCIYEGKNL